MKAIVVELNHKFAAVLSDDGCVKTIKNDNYEVGQVIQLHVPQKHNLVKKVTVFAASAAACLFLGIGTWAYASPYTYVSVDVNPSIEFTVNRFDRVIKVKAVNDDGEAILQDISLDDLTNDSITDAVTKTVQQISEAGYFDSDIQGGIVIATSSEDTDRADELAAQLQETVEQETIDNGEDVVVEAFSVGLERVEEARELGVTPGKLNLVEKLQAASDNPEAINIEEWLDKPVKDIMKATKDYKKAAESRQTETSEDISGDTAETASEDSLSEDSSNEDTNQNETTADDGKNAGKAAKDAEKAQKEDAKADNKTDVKEDGKADEAKGNQDNTAATSDKKSDKKTDSKQSQKENNKTGKQSTDADQKTDQGTKKQDESSGSSSAGQNGKGNQNNQDNNNKGSDSQNNNNSNSTENDSSQKGKQDDSINQGSNQDIPDQDSSSDQDVTVNQDDGQLQNIGGSDKDNRNDNSETGGQNSDSDRHNSDNGNNQNSQNQNGTSGQSDESGNSGDNRGKGSH